MKSQEVLSAISAILIFGSAHASSERVDLQFDALDVNGDRVLTRSEVDSQPDLVVLMNLYGKNGFAFADFNGDGVVDRHELHAHEESISAE